MLHARTGGIPALIAAGLLLLVVRPAFEAIRQTREGVARAGTAGAHYLSAAAFGTLVKDIKAQIGADGELLDLSVSRWGGGNVKYRTGDRAAGYQWGPGIDGLQPLKVRLLGSGRLADNVFPVAKLRADAPSRLEAAARASAGADFELQTMTLALAPVTPAVRWTVTGTGGGRSLVFTARPDGSGLERVG